MMTSPKMSDVCSNTTAEHNFTFSLLRLNEDWVLDTTKMRIFVWIIHGIITILHLKTLDNTRKVGEMSATKLRIHV